MGATHINMLSLTAAERRSVGDLLADIQSTDGLSRQNAFVDRAHLLAHELPRRIREAFYAFKRQEQDAALLVTENPVLDEELGDTPVPGVEQDPEYRLNKAQLLHGLYGSLLGEPISFKCQRDGAIYNNIVPLPEFANVANISSGYRFRFGFHVEDAFHPAMADYIGLVCMRNFEQANTRLSSINGLELSEEDLDLLFQENFVISHNALHQVTGDQHRKAKAVLFGSRERPYLRINTCVMQLDDYEPRARAALQRLIDHLEFNKVSIKLQTGDCLYIDNFRCAHARDPYEPQFGPKVRWLSRLVLVNDLRRSRMFRREAASRVIYD